MPKTASKSNPVDKHFRRLLVRGRYRDEAERLTGDDAAFNVYDDVPDAIHRLIAEPEERVDKLMALEKAAACAPTQEERHQAVNDLEELRLEQLCAAEEHAYLLGIAVGARLAALKVQR